MATLTVSPLVLSAVVLGVLGLLLTIGLLCRQLLVGRSRFAGELRELVQVVEDLRGGKARRPADADPRSPLVPLSDALSRLGHDLHGRWSEAEAAADRWRALIDASDAMAVITTDTDGDIRSFSSGATALFGWEEDEVLSRPAAVVFEEHAYKDLLPQLARRSVRKQGVSAHSRLLRRDGTSFDAEVTIRLLASVKDQPVGFMMVVRDRTEQLRLETELRESERRHRKLIEGLSEGVVIVQAGVLAYANPAAERLLGRSRQELEGRPLRECVATSDVLVVDELLRNASGRMDGHEELRCTLVGSDGTPRATVRLRAAAVEYDAQPAVLLRLLDETDERRTQAELAHNEARLDAVIEATSDGIVVLSDTAQGTRVQLTNRAFAELFGLGVEQVLGRPGAELFELLRTRGAGGQRLAELIGGAEPQPVRASLSLEGGAGRALEVTIAPLVGSRGESLGRVVACRDVTEQRRSERQLQEQAERLQLGKIELEQSYLRLNEVNRQLQRRGEELDRLNQELRKLNEMKTNLLGNVSHELQTPLVAIRGYTEMILKERLGPISEEQRKGLDLSLKNIDRLISMIDGLLDFARGGAEDESLSLSRFPLRALVEEALATLRDRIAARRLDVAVALAGGLEIEADRNKVLQVLLNLLSNAIKFNREGGRIEVSAVAGRIGFVTVRVRDTGIGIPDHSVGRIFERGFRVERPRGVQPEGSGIGLALVHQILRLHGCTITVQSQEGSGSEFVFTLPGAALRDSAAKSAGAPADPVDAGSPAAGAAPRESAAGVNAGGQAGSEVRSKSRPRSPGSPRPRLRIIRRYREDELR